MANRTGIVLGTLGFAVWASYVTVDSYNEHRAAERESRESDILAAAGAYLDPIAVNETGETEGIITASLIHSGGGTALSACEITYSRHPDDNRTFDPDSLELGNCFD